MITKSNKHQFIDFFILVTYLVSNKTNADKNIEENGNQTSISEEKTVFDSYDQSYTISVEVITEVTTNKIPINETADIDTVYSERYSDSKKMSQANNAEQLLLNISRDNNHTQVLDSNIKNSNVTTTAFDNENNMSNTTKNPVLTHYKDFKTENNNSKVINAESQIEHENFANDKLFSILNESIEKDKHDKKGNSNNLSDIDSSDLEIRGSRRTYSPNVFLDFKESKLGSSNKITNAHYHPIITRKGLIYSPHTNQFSKILINTLRIKKPYVHTTNQEKYQRTITQTTDNIILNNPEFGTIEPKLEDYSVLDEENQYPFVTSYILKPSEIIETSTNSDYQLLDRLNNVLFRKLVEASEHPIKILSDTLKNCQNKKTYT